MENNNTSATYELKSSALVSGLKYMQQDIRFIKKILSKNIYNASIPNLFEKLQLYTTSVLEIEERFNLLIDTIEEFEKNSSSTSKNNKKISDDLYFQKHTSFNAEYKKMETDFLEYKYKVFSYLEGVLDKK